MRIIRDPDPVSAARTARAQLRRWKRRGAPPESPEERADLATHETVEAQRWLRNCMDLLAPRPGPDDGGAIPSRNELPPPRGEQYQGSAIFDARPVPPRKPEMRPRPTAEDPAFRPALTPLDHLLPARRRRRRGEADRRLAKAQALWDEERDRVDAAYEEACTAYRVELEAWKGRVAALARSRARAESATYGRDGRVDPCQRVLPDLRRALEAAAIPLCDTSDIDITFDAGEGRLALRVRLPDCEALPTLQSVEFDPASGMLLERHLGRKALERLHASYTVQLPLRLIRDAFHADRARCVGTVSVEGWRWKVDPATGRGAPHVEVRVAADRARFLGLDLQRADARACIEALGGRFGPDNPERMPEHPATDQEELPPDPLERSAAVALPAPTAPTEPAPAPPGPPVAASAPALAPVAALSPVPPPPPAGRDDAAPSAELPSPRPVRGGAPPPPGEPSLRRGVAGAPASRALSDLPHATFRRTVQVIMEREFGSEARFRLTDTELPEGVEGIGEDPGGLRGGGFVLHAYHGSESVGSVAAETLHEAVSAWGAARGILMATGGVTPAVAAFARDRNMVVVAGTDLEALAIRHRLVIPAGHGAQAG